MLLPINRSGSTHTAQQGYRGYTYLTILVILAMLASGLALLGEVWHTVSVREKEAELLFIGHQYRTAIGRYYLSGQRQYPRDLDDLLKDPRRPTIERYLRKRYIDPITGKSEWGIVKAPDGGVWGVYSLSESRPLKAANFRLQDEGFDNAEKYSDWKFIHTPLRQMDVVKPVPKQPALKP